jgi:hypothetical protein
MRYVVRLVAGEILASPYGSTRVRYHFVSNYQKVPLAVFDFKHSEKVRRLI